MTPIVSIVSTISSPLETSTNPGHYSTMSISIKTLLDAPFNRKHKLFALYRFLFWKCIRLFKLKGIRFDIWEDRTILLNYDSFQCMWIMYNYVVDWEEFHLIKRYLRLSDKAADIGANMGFYTVWMSKFIGVDGRLFSFEPDELNYSRLQKNIALNKLQKLVSASQMAVSDVNGQLPFTVGLDGENHITQKVSGDTTCIHSVSLDSYMEKEKVEALAYVKIDVEGFEYAVLSGASNLLAAKKIDILQLEINQTIRNSGATINQLLDKLKKNGYSLCRFDIDKNELYLVDFATTRENYFAVYDLNAANRRLKENYK